MVTERYVFSSGFGKKSYFFESVGSKGKIAKIVRFKQKGDNRWNVGFGDYKHGTLNDGILTQNNDARKVIATVAFIILDFLKEHPDSTILINPVDERRKVFYNRIFQRYHLDLITGLTIFGRIDNKKIKYTPQHSFDSFEISLKK